MDPWIYNMPLYGQSGTPVYRQLRTYSGPNNASTLNYMPFAPLYQTGLTVYDTDSSNENQSDSSSPSLSEPAGSTSDDITAPRKMWLKEEVSDLFNRNLCKKKKMISRIQE